MPGWGAPGGRTRVAAAAAVTRVPPPPHPAVFPLRCPVRNYAWGQRGLRSAVAQLVASGDPAASVEPERPYAEVRPRLCPSVPAARRPSGAERALTPSPSYGWAPIPAATPRCWMAVTPRGRWAPGWPSTPPAWAPRCATPLAAACPSSSRCCPSAPPSPSRRTPTR